MIRWGGEEFLVVMPDTDTPGALTAIRRLRGAQRLRPDGNPQTASIGIAECIAEAPESSTQLVEIADHRMYTSRPAKTASAPARKGYRRAARGPGAGLSGTPSVPQGLPVGGDTDRLFFRWANCLIIRGSRRDQPRYRQDREDLSEGQLLARKLSHQERSGDTAEPAQTQHPGNAGRPSVGRVEPAAAKAGSDDIDGFISVPPTNTTNRPRLPATCPMA